MRGGERINLQTVVLEVVFIGDLVVVVDPVVNGFRIY